MAGKRMIHDRICESRKTNGIDGFTEMVWVRLLTKADDNGNFYRDARRVFAYCLIEKHGANEKNTEQAIRDLIKADLLKEFQADGRAYIHLTDFHEWQDLRKDKNAQIAHPVHPPEMGGAYIGEGLRGSTWVEQKDRLKVTGLWDEGNRPVTHGDQVSGPKEEVEVEVKGECEGELGAVAPPTAQSEKQWDEYQERQRRDHDRREAKAASKGKFKSKPRQFGRPNVESEPKRSKAEERVERAREACRVLEDPTRLPASLRPILPAGGSR